MTVQLTQKFADALREVIAKQDREVIDNFALGYILQCPVIDHFATLVINDLGVSPVLKATATALLEQLRYQCEVDGQHAPWLHVEGKALIDAIARESAGGFPPSSERRQ